ncbi:2Fe-2S iron-sulfur cluster-binding protein [Bdellovibrio sp. KM01]|uniref:2Fe-2S iron-sulfur cluster-binding protein n=1 Tax=Bdellovibrio sp. KM01 TaxID=2748865 RepID=UPI0021049379|nr:2Fe-2S iron-sulfur cluster-binding protein [Bdellovibrio sp. KM01]
MKPKSGKYITFLPDGIDVLVSQKDQSVLDVAVREGFALDHTCGGFGTCGTCRIFVRQGLEKLPPRNDIEADIAEDRGFRDFERLACQTEPIDGLVIERPTKDARNKD